MSEYTLTPVKDSMPSTSVSIECSTPTANMVEYGLRDCGLDSEYHLANRLQMLRKACLDMVAQMKSEGYHPSTRHLELIDVEVEVLAKKRLTL